MTSRHAHMARTATHRAALGVLVLSLAMLAAPADAAPIVATVEGCVTELPNGRATWTSTEHFQFVAFWDPIAGCDATIAHPVTLHEWFDNFDGMGGLQTATLLHLFPTCGRIQFDAHSYINPTSDILDPLGLVSLVFNTGVDCAPPGPPGPGVPRGPQAPEPYAIVLLGVGIAMALRSGARRMSAKHQGPV